MGYTGRVWNNLGAMTQSLPPSAPWYEFDELIPLGSVEATSVVIWATLNSGDVFIAFRPNERIRVAGPHPCGCPKQDTDRTNRAASCRHPPRSRPSSGHVGTGRSS